MSKRILVTGAAGFIGFHLAQLLLSNGWRVLGYDALNDYYDPALKKARLDILNKQPNFEFVGGAVEEMDDLAACCKAFEPEIIVHLAAQAGVRYSLENPSAYIQSNVVGTFNVLEIARSFKVEHLLMASTSSVYGANTEMPYAETHKADLPLTIYAATKKSGEAMGHAYAHLHDLPVTMFRFFTVYGPWGRPDMAYFSFADRMMKGQAIDIHNHGNMYRDFTYVDDLVRGIRLLIDRPPAVTETGLVIENDNLSPVAPFRVVNIGNNDKVLLTDFIDALEAALGVTAKRNFVDIKPGEVTATWADASLLKALTGYAPKTDVQTGLKHFVKWYRDFYDL